MAKLTRTTAKVFGETADATLADPEIGQFGSAKAGTYNGTGDVATIQGLTAWSNGWIDAVTPTQQFPPLPEMTGVHKVLSYQNAYLLQEGVAEYDANTTYWINSVCKATSGTGALVLYRSLIDNNTGNLLSDTTKWQEIYKLDGTVGTMTANLIINNDAPSVTAKDTEITFGTAPATNKYRDSLILADTNGLTMGAFTQVNLANGSHYTRLYQKKSSSENTYAIMDVGFNSNGNAFCEFPNTTCCDGQWTYKGETANNNTNKNTGYYNYSLSSYLPNDSKNYEVIVNTTMAQNESNTDGFVIFSSDIISEYGTTLSYSQIIHSKRENNSSANTAGQIIIPVGTGRKLYYRIGGANLSNIYIRLLGYRRIGTNG